MKAALGHLDHIEDVITRPSSFYEVLDDMPAAEREEILNGVQRLREVIAQAFKQFDFPLTETAASRWHILTRRSCQSHFTI